MAAGDIPQEVLPASSDDTGLHSFTKLAIAYIGILLGLTIISVIFEALLRQMQPEASPPCQACVYHDQLLVLVPILVAAAIGLVAFALIRRWRANKATED